MFGRVIRDISTSEEIGVSIISVDKAVFNNMFKNIKTDADILIMDNKNIVYFSGSEKKLKAKELVSALENEGKQGSVIKNINGTKYSLNFQTNLKTNWKIVSIIPYQNIVKELNFVRIITASLLLIAFLIAMLGALLISKKITKQLELLRIMTLKMESREYISGISFDNRDEIGKIGNRFVELYNRNNELTTKLYESQLKEKEAELLALQSHINPHFLYNTLNSIFWMAEKAKVKPISKMAVSLSKLFKLTLNNGNHITTVRNEIEQLKSYLQIQNIRFDNKIEYSIDIDPTILDEKMIKLLLQPLVENAVQHGLEQQNKQGKIMIKGIKKEGKMIFEVIDNGVGFNNSEEFLLKNPGYALKNINERIKLHYGPEFGLNITSKLNEGTKVVLTIGIKSED
jgi:two-component system sensor histidine kinase YesM